MKTLVMLIGSVSVMVSLTLYSVFPGRLGPDPVGKEKGCVFNSMMGIESTEHYARYKTPEEVGNALDRGLKWISTAQQQNGGWGAGSHYDQGQMNPHAVVADPATTAMVGMALLRNGSTLEKGAYSNELKRAVEYILEQVHRADPNALNITELQHTQIQTKLGQNIDVVLAAQFLTNLLDRTPRSHALRKPMEQALNVCVQKIQRGQMEDGSTRGAGWAGVLQSSLASNALESAAEAGADVDTDMLERAKDYQKSNVDVATGNVKTERGAGIVLYSVSGSARAAAAEARQTKERLQQAKNKGLIADEAQVTTEVLRKIGLTEEEAIKAETAYRVYESAKQTAQRQDVMQGFGNNGGEEFLSFLQTGEGLVIANDNAWKNWYDDVSGKMIRIQNQNGSWNGHHCITSPVFCTATCLLILSIENDLDQLRRLGGS